jgi:3-hydroxyacyl-CoA dehydrogenase
MVQNSIAVIGQGFVGGSLTTVFSERGFDVYTFDKTGKQVIGGKNPSLTTVLSVQELVASCEAKENFLKFILFVFLPPCLRMVKPIFQ